MKYLSIILILFFVSCNEFKGRIISVHDGDTVTLLSDGKIYKIRLAEIDANELGQPFGNQAKEYLSNLVLNKAIVAKQIDIDKYGRHVCKLFLNGSYVNELMVISGNAWCYKKYASSKLYNEELIAKSERLGLWQDNNCIPPIYAANENGTENWYWKAKKLISDHEKQSK